MAPRRRAFFAAAAVRKPSFLLNSQLLFCLVMGSDILFCWFRGFPCPRNLIVLPVGWTGEDGGFVSWTLSAKTLRSWLGSSGILMLYALKAIVKIAYLPFTPFTIVLEAGAFLRTFLCVSLFAFLGMRLSMKILRRKNTFYSGATPTLCMLCLRICSGPWTSGRAA